ncbi:MAG: flavodoxin [Porphyromonadaceae bacterium]|nr:MAG: flavodoxin [Porphyromonadaceae bacterium]
MDKIAILFGPTGGNTEKAARMVAKAFGEDQTHLIPVKDAQESDLMPFSRIIFGGPTIGTHTWSDDNQKKDWDIFLTRLYKMNLKGKSCAVFGLGDQVSYSFKFVDDIGIIADHAVQAGGKLVGLVDPEGYTFDESKAFRNGKFLGLPLDEDNEPELTHERINHWVELLKTEF